MIDNWKRILNLCLVLSSLLIITSFLFISFSRINYGFDLEWVEGSLLDHVWRLYDRLPLYIEPSADFITTNYAPLYYYACIILWKISEPDYWQGRLISIISTLIIAFFIFRIVVRERKDWITGLACAGLFISTYARTGYWFDLIRNDMLTIAFFIISIYLALDKQSIRNIILSGIFSALAILTKQNFIISAFFMALGIIYMQNLKQALIYVSSLLLFLIPVLLFFHFTSNGWSTYHMFILPAYTPLAYNPISFIKLLFFNDIGIYSIPIIAIIILIIYLFSMKIISLSKEIVFLIILLAGSFIQSINNRIHFGSFINQYIIVYVLLSLLIGLFAVKLNSTNMKIRLLFSVLILFQSICFYAIWDFYVPSAKEKQKVLEFRKKLDTLSKFGNIYMPYHGFLSRKHSKNTTIHLMTALSHFNTTDKCKTRKQAYISFIDSIQKRKYEVIIWDKFRNVNIRKIPYEEYLLYTNNYKPVAFFKDPPLLMNKLTLMDVHPFQILIRRDIPDEKIKEVMNLAK
ncbi:MAG: glycosyltransferase family 39 protein [Candidatus Coatesbacteria bacterium]|nr:glycosyltransferase family 39 protein [Candidatus Coatesbacteria bacterium]